MQSPANIETRHSLPKLDPPPTTRPCAAHHSAIPRKQSSPPHCQPFQRPTTPQLNSHSYGSSPTPTRLHPFIWQCSAVEEILVAILRPNPHRTLDAMHVQIHPFFLWCWLRAVWIPPFTSTGPICLHRIACRVPRPVWIGPEHPTTRFPQTWSRTHHTTSQRWTM